MPADSQNVSGLTLPTSITPCLLHREFEKLNTIFCRIPHRQSLGITSVPTLMALVCYLETDTGLQATRKQQGPAFLQQVLGLFLQFLEDQKQLRAWLISCSTSQTLGHSFGWPVSSPMCSEAVVHQGGFWGHQRQGRPCWATSELHLAW